MERIGYQSLVYYQFESLKAEAVQHGAVQHGVFTRLGGVSEGAYRSLNLSRSTGDTPEPVRENRRRMFEALGYRPERSLTSWLVHSNTVRVVSDSNIGQDDVHADAMVTNTRGLALTLRFADCVPVLFYDARRQAIGIAHAGWVGITVGVLPATVQALRSAFGSDPADIRACIGPSIGPDRFEVGEDVAARIQAAVPEPVIGYPRIHSNVNESVNESETNKRMGPLLGPATDDAQIRLGVVPGAPFIDIREDSQIKPHVDLWRAAAAQLRAAGVGEIEISGMCTASNTAEWFSHRAEKGKTGRFGVAISLAP